MYAIPAQFCNRSKSELKHIHTHSMRFTFISFDLVVVRPVGSVDGCTACDWTRWWNYENEHIWMCLRTKKTWDEMRPSAYRRPMAMGKLYTLYIPKTLKLNPLPGRALFLVGCCNVVLSFVIGIIISPSGSAVVRQFFSTHQIVCERLIVLHLFPIRVDVSSLQFACNIIFFPLNFSATHSVLRITWAAAQQLRTRFDILSTLNIGISHEHCVWRWRFWF